MTTWHEMVTWFGYKSTGFITEEPSAFSWEDIYSNLIGIRIGAQAVEDKEHNYDTAVTLLIKKELENLQIQPQQHRKKCGRESARPMVCWICDS